MGFCSSHDDHHYCETIDIFTCCSSVRVIYGISMMATFSDQCGVPVFCCESTLEEQASTVLT